MPSLKPAKKRHGNPSRGRSATGLAASQIDALRPPSYRSQQTGITTCRPDLISLAIISTEQRLANALKALPGVVPALFSGPQEVSNTPAAGVSHRQ